MVLTCVMKTPHSKQFERMSTEIFFKGRNILFLILFRNTSACEQQSTTDLELALWLFYGSLQRLPFLHLTGGPCLADQRVPMAGTALCCIRIGLTPPQCLLLPMSSLAGHFLTLLPSVCLTLVPGVSSFSVHHLLPWHHLLS